MKNISHRFCLLIVLCCLSDAAFCNPSSPVVTSGNVDIATSGSSMTITQNSPSAIIDWSSFSVLSGETVDIFQPTSTSTLLLRVTGTAPSEISGIFRSNGRVFLVDSNGIRFDTSATANVGGLVVSTQDISDQNYLSNTLKLGAASRGTLVNSGMITATSGGSVYLVSPSLDNAGAVNAPGGQIFLASGNSVVDLSPQTPVVRDAAGNAASLTTNNGTLDAQGGSILVYSGGGIAQNGRASTDSPSGPAGNIVFDAGGNLDLALSSTTNSSGGHISLTGASVATYGSVNVGTGTVSTNAVTVSNSNGTRLDNGAGGCISISGASCGSLVTGGGTSGSGMVDGGSGAVAAFVYTPILQPVLPAGWNLLGNGESIPIDVATVFGDAAKIVSVWKWNPATQRWAFYAPSLSQTGLSAYAAQYNYDVLTAINGAEGFWVNAKAQFNGPNVSGNPVPAGTFRDPAKLAKGWNLIAVGDSPTPSAFNVQIGATPPASGVIPSNVVSIWAWDNASSSWYFYAPSLDANGTLASYIASHHLLDFGNMTIGPGTGFWVNHP